MPFPLIKHFLYFKMHARYFIETWPYNTKFSFKNFGTIHYPHTWDLTSLNLLNGTFSGLRQFFETEIPLKMIINAFYFTSKALFVLKIFKFFSWLFDGVAKWPDKKDEVNSKFCDVTGCLTNNRNTHIAQYFNK